MPTYKHNTPYIGWYLIRARKMDWLLSHGYKFSDIAARFDLTPHYCMMVLERYWNTQREANHVSNTSPA